MENLSFENVKIIDGFWKHRYDLNRKVSLKAVYERFEESGRFDALRYNFREGKPFPHIFFDSDVAKWIEAVGYLIISEGGGYKEEQEIIDGLIESMKQNQLPDGYLNAYFIQVEPSNRFTNRRAHELYCAGHLIEGAISYDKATGKHDFLEIIKKYVDCIYKYFITDKLAKFYTCGHEEIKLALVKLYDYTGEKKYLDLAIHFLFVRGTKEEKEVIEGVTNAKYDQIEIPVRELSLAEGHAVRATYLYIAMAEIALKTGDEDLFNACTRIWRDIIDKKMYITGGIGSCRTGECFTSSYDLPNLETYTESCASIGLLLFALSMQKFGINSEYPAVIERIMYNGLLSSTSLDGKSFFYENPLEIHLASVDKETAITAEHRKVLPIRHRKEVFLCSCCPPNINRIFARIGDLFFAKHDNCFIVNQYANICYNGEDANIKVVTDYPNNGKVVLEVKKCTYSKILLRIPEWCEKYSLNVEYIAKNGYIEILPSVDRVEINFNMEPYFVECNPKVRDNNGRVALCYGPMVYCIEKLDNDFELNALSVDTKSPVTVLGVQEEYGMKALKVKALLDNDFNSLYRKLKNTKTEIELLFRPYWTFANREECDMLVWLRKN